MKIIFIPLALSAMIISLLFGSCNANKTAQSSTPTSSKTKKKTTAVSPKKEEAVPKSQYIEVPPMDIKNNFTSRFPSAEKPNWKKQFMSTDSAMAKTNYNVAFVESGKKNWVTYTDKGEVIEERQEILVDQLPQNIYNALRISYPTYSVASATTYKSIKKEGSYSVMLKPLSKFDTKQIEVILTESALVVE